jgi:hypothetical protein
MREWFVLIEGKKTGPFTPEELRVNQKITPDTLVWKKGFSTWVKAAEVKELRKIFKDEVKKEKKPSSKQSFSPGHEQILTDRLPPHSFFFWFLICLVILLYSIYRLYYVS